jgi:hypothetical protein
MLQGQQRRGPRCEQDKTSKFSGWKFRRRVRGVSRIVPGLSTKTSAAAHASPSLGLHDVRFAGSTQLHIRHLAYHASRPGGALQGVDIYNGAWHLRCVIRSNVLELDQVTVSPAQSHPSSIRRVRHGWPLEPNQCAVVSKLRDTAYDSSGVWSGTERCSVIAFIPVFILIIGPTHPYKPLS